jgi:short subunit fatty acids transporter
MVMASDLFAWANCNVMQTKCKQILQILRQYVAAIAAVQYVRKVVPALRWGLGMALGGA